MFTPSPSPSLPPAGRAPDLPQRPDASPATWVQACPRGARVGAGPVGAPRDRRRRARWGWGQGPGGGPFCGPLVGGGEVIRGGEGRGTGELPHPEGPASPRRDRRPRSHSAGRARPPGPEASRRAPAKHFAARPRIGPLPRELGPNLKNRVCFRRPTPSPPTLALCGTLRHSGEPLPSPGGPSLPPGEPSLGLPR